MNPQLEAIFFFTYLLKTIPRFRDGYIKYIILQLKKAIHQYLEIRR